ncbi:protein GVQW3-like [Odontomachus brunneus]|uniref:protein GVQW3-like n=1 Tax=Odontomachus brunneus TaxID=486640 RepID=UPI0013F2230A|nr:protein GVQW3-like [Odontomachus brunneus]
MDQRICIKFCVKNKIKCADAFRMLTVAYGEATLDRSNVYRWYKMFSEGREDVNDEERAGRPSTSTTDENIDEVKKIVLTNRRITVREVAEDLNIAIGSCHSIFTNDLGMKRVAAKFVPKLLNFDQKQHRINIGSCWTLSATTQICSKGGVVHHEFLPQGRTVNKEYYLQVMLNLREAIRQKRPEEQKLAFAP